MHTIGMNGKGGMNKEEFEHHIDNSIIPLFPYLEDTPGECIVAQGWQQPQLQLAGPAQQVLVQGCLHLPRPAQLYLHAAGDGH